MTHDRPVAIASYCSSRSWGGLEMNVLHLVRWLRERGREAYVYARPDSPLFERAGAAGMPVRAITIDSKVSALWQARRLARLVSDDNIRFLIVNRSPDLLAGILTRQYRRRKVGIIFCQHMDIPGNKKDLAHAWLFRQLDAFVTPVNWLAKRVKERTVLREEQIHVIPHGIEIDRFTSKPGQLAARRRLGLPEGLPLMGIVGRLDRKKGQDVVIKALRKLHDAGHEVHLLIAGALTPNESTGFEPYLKSLVEEFRLKEFVHFRPHQEQPEVAFAALDTFVLATDCETYGMVTIEAMCSGLPVIGTDDGGTVDIIDHERTGLRFPPRDDTALAEALQRYLTDPDFAAEMARAAREVAMNRFAHTAQVTAWERLIERL